jgi:hypothetical protein
MEEYYIELLDENGTGYGCADIVGNQVYFEDLEESKLFCKCRVDETYVVSRVIDSKGNVVHFEVYK